MTSGSNWESGTVNIFPIFFSQYDLLFIDLIVAIDRHKLAVASIMLKFLRQLRRQVIASSRKCVDMRSRLNEALVGKEIMGLMVQP
jgi:hypothetical protein